MKKLIIFFIFLFISHFSYSQFRISLQLSPLFSVNRVEESSDSLSITPGGARLKLAGGAVFDVFLKENYYFSTGALYVPKYIGLTILHENDNREITQDYNLQYLRIPLTFRVFTNEISLDKRIYFQFGLTGDIKLNEKNDSDEPVYIQKFSTFDGSALIGFGLEYRVGYNTTIFGGFSYSRGLVNVVDNQVELDGDLEVRNDIFGIDVGIYF